MPCLISRSLAFLLFIIAQTGYTNDLQAGIIQALEREELVGASWALLPGDGSIAVSSAGFSNAETLEPMTNSHRVLTGSLAKVVLATGVFRLISENRLSLDTPVTQLLPDLDFDNPWKRENPVQVRHLLSHTSGLENLRLWQVFSLEAKADAPLSDIFDRSPSQLHVRTRPGDQYLYSNIGYTLIGMIIESVTGERYETYLQRELLTPLSMNDSTFKFTSQTGTHADQLLAMGHFEKGQTQVNIPTHLRPAGQFSTTAGDMGKFAHFLMGDGRISGKPFIRKDLLKATGWPKGTGAQRAGLAIGHGLSLAARDRHSVIGLCHPGTTVGFRAMLCLYPQEKKAFFIAHNTDSESADYEAFNELLLQQLHLQSPSPVAVKKSAPLPAGWAGFYAPDPVGIEAFSWIDTVFNFVEVRPRGKQIQIDPFQSSAIDLAPAGRLLYRANDRRIASHVLFENSNGQRTLSNGLRSYSQIPAAALALLWVSLGLGLLGLLYICLAGSIRALAGRLNHRAPLFIPLCGCLVILVPVPFFFSQSFLQLGDITTASILLAAVTTALPIALVAGLIVQYRQGLHGLWAIVDTTAMTLALQWVITLMLWGMLPLRLWV